MKVVAQGTFSRLTHFFMSRWLCTCNSTNMCELKTFLPLLLNNKGNQLTVITIINSCILGSVLAALKNCKAAMFFEITYQKCNFSTTYEDMMAIFDLPNLQRLMISPDCEKLCNATEGTFVSLIELMGRVAEKKNHFKFSFRTLNQNYFLKRPECSLTRINSY